MIIKLDSIPDEGLELDETRPPEWLTNFTELVDGDDISAAGPVTFQLKVTCFDEQVHVKGRISVPIRTGCARCVAEVVSDAEAPVDVVLVPETPDEMGEDAEDEGYGTYRGEEIDLAAYLRGQLSLYFPSKFLCNPDCKGLCPRCGADMNKEKCTCKTETTDPRWAALGKFKL